MHISSISQVQQAVLSAFQQCGCSRLMLNLSSAVLGIDNDKRNYVDKKNSIQKKRMSTEKENVATVVHGAYLMEVLFWILCFGKSVHMDHWHHAM